MESSSTQRQNIYVPIAIVIAGAIIGTAVFFGTKGGGNPTAHAQPEPPAPSPVADISKVNTQGEPFIGSPNAPAIAYWYDYQCPFCKQNEETAMPQLVREYVDTGKIRIVFKDYQFLSEDSQRLGKVSRAVWDTDPSKFYQWHKAVYDNQGTENTGWATDAKILSISTSVLGAADAQKVMQLAVKNGDVYQKEMDADKAEGTAFGINGTPGFIIGKQRVDGAVPYAQIKAAVDAAL